MPGTMSRADLVADMKASLHDAANVFTAANDADFSRMLDIAALDLGRVRPRTLLGSITLVADTDAYAAPTDLIAFKADMWSQGKVPQPWEANYPGQLPRVSVFAAGLTRQLVFSPAPTALQIALFGAAYKFYYLAGHVVASTASNTSVVAGDRNILLLRCQAEAMRELAIRGVTKPVSLRDGMSQHTRNGTPGYLYEAMLKEFEAAA